MRKIDLLLSEYGESHRNETNKLGSFANWATVVLILVLIYYLSLSVPLTVGMLFFSLFCLALANFLNIVTSGKLWVLSLVIFVLAWIIQFVGHKIEGKKPSFFKDVQFLMIGPAWLMHFIYKKIGVAY
jgi:uncharacterized membrane protein YGL010W